MAKRVYFAFHYKDVIEFRANVVRNHNVPEGVEKAGYFDASIWEDAKNTNPASLKKLINAELEGTTVTAVLIGSDTWARPWVRYEILKSIPRGSRLIGIHINGIAGSIAGKSDPPKPLGPNPFDNLGLIISPDGNTAQPTEWVNGGFQKYTEVDPWKIAVQQTEANRGKHWPLSHWFKVHDWIRGDGYNNFNKWIG
jgi:hypothetical protein